MTTGSWKRQSKHMSPRLGRCAAMAWVLCAWILWSGSLVQVEQGKAVSRAREWDIVSAHDTHQACRKEQAAILAMVAKSRPPKESREGFSTAGSDIISEMFGADGKVLESMRERLLCLPSGTDPRPSRSRH